MNKQLESLIDRVSTWPQEAVGSRSSKDIAISAFFGDRERRE